MFNSYHDTAGTVQGVVGWVMVVASDACGDGDVIESGVVDSDVVVVVGGVFVDVARDARSTSQQFFREVRAARVVESASMVPVLRPPASQSWSVSGMPPALSSASETKLISGKREKPIEKKVKKGKELLVRGGKQFKNLLMPVKRIRDHMAARGRKSGGRGWFTLRGRSHPSCQRRRLRRSV